MRRHRTYGQWWEAEGPYVDLAIAPLEAFGTAVYQAVGATEDDARFLFATNLDKALQGDHARGLGKVPGIVRAARDGTFDLSAPIHVVRSSTASAVVDGGKTAHGRLVCRRGMRLAIDMARAHGIAIVGARASGELLTPFVSMAAAEGLVAMAMVQSVPTVAPLGGYQPLLGNAPMAFAVPAEGRDPVILDMSFTQSSASGVLLAAAQGQTVPPGCLLDEQGQPTTDARAFPDNELIAKTGGIAVRGTLTPLGNNHKGYAMVFMVGLLASVLTDTSPPWDLDWKLAERGTYGTVLIAIDPTALNPNNPAAKVDDYIDHVTTQPRRDDAEGILYPGQRSQELKRERRLAGVVPVPESHVTELERLGVELGIPLDASAAANQREGGA